MKQFLYFVFMLMLAMPLQAEEPPAGFTPLFNGVDLSGWHGDNPHETVKHKDRQAALQAQVEAFSASWSVEDGILVNNGEGPYATTNREYGDYELRIDFKLVPGADSGVYLRGNPQVQIWDTTDEKKWRFGAQKGSGGLWNNPGQLGGRMPLLHADRPVGEWNHMRIRQVGSRTWVWLNDQLVVDGVIMSNYFDRKTPLPSRAPLPARGSIHLQTHGGEMRWRNIFIREIPAEEANRLLAGIDNEGFTPMFNGRDFSGWWGGLAEYAAEDGVITCLKGGNIFTERTYTNFTWKLEFKLPAGGNNGLAIRYPGAGNPAHAGMCELQVLDNAAPNYATLDPRQYHGSAYGKAAAVRGYQRPAGEWNYQVVRVSGTRIAVELNGTPILDADLSKVTEFMKGAFTDEIPEAGHLGFAGHGAGVAFRNLLVRDEASP